MRAHLVSFGAAAALFAATSLQASAATYSFDYVGTDGLTAIGTLDVVAGQAISGAGTITAPFLDGGGTEILTLVTLSTPGVHDLGGGDLSYRFGGGTDLIGDTAYPIDAYGPVFFVSGPGDTGFNFWFNGGGQYQGLVAGDNNYNGEFGAASFALVPTPLPSNWTMLIAGFVGLGFFAFRGTKKGCAAIAAA
jgi:hypothetical protein